MHVNYVAVLIAAAVQFLLGILWYKVIFRKSWAKLTGCEGSDKLANSIFGFVTFYIACFLLSFVMAHIDALGGAKSADLGARYGVLCWLGMIAPPMFAQHIFERRRANLFAINGAFWLLAMAVGSALVASFR
jgi:hypothetical protein